MKELNSFGFKFSKEIQKLGLFVCPVNRKVRVFKTSVYNSMEKLVEFSRNQSNNS